MLGLLSANTRLGNEPYPIQAPIPAQTTGKSTTLLVIGRLATGLIASLVLEAFRGTQ